MSTLVGLSVCGKKLKKGRKPYLKLNLKTDFAGLVKQA